IALGLPARGGVTLRLDIRDPDLPSRVNVTVEHRDEDESVHRPQGPPDRSLMIPLVLGADDRLRVGEPRPHDAGPATPATQPR
ncbi:MAG: hypothetical protein ACLFU2_14450, partial [Opitutales bacterium]